MKMIQIRNVPDELHRSLKVRAAREGTTLSELILSDLPRLANKPSPQELLERVRSREPVGGASAVDLIRADRADR
jgi:hypothetical protein